MVRPAVLDLKIGMRHYSDDAAPSKKAKEIRKAAQTTICTHGLRIVGCRIPFSHSVESRASVDGANSVTSGWREVWGYKLGRDATQAELPAVLHRFLGTQERVRAASEFTKELRDVMQAQRDYVFYGSSLLMVYDADAGPTAPLRIKMIDFGHVHNWAPASEGATLPGEFSHEYHPGNDLPGLASDGYLFGLGTLLNILADKTLRSELVPASTWGNPGRWSFSGVL